MRVPAKRKVEKKPDFSDGILQAYNLRSQSPDSVLPNDMDEKSLRTVIGCIQQFFLEILAAEGPSEASQANLDRVAFLVNTHNRTKARKAFDTPTEYKYLSGKLVVDLQEIQINLSEIYRGDGAAKAQ